MNHASGKGSWDHCGRFTLEQVADLLKTSASVVQERTNRGELIALSFGTSVPRVRYPAFQFFDEFGDLVREVLRLLTPLDAYAYLVAFHPDMAGLTPLEVQLGLPADSRPLTEEAQEFLRRSSSERTATVLEWCQVYKRQQESQ